MARPYRLRLREFARSISGSDKTPYFYPPWKYLDALEGQRLETLDGFRDAICDIDAAENKLNLYLHFPLCRKKCNFCSYTSGEHVLRWADHPPGPWQGDTESRKDAYERLLIAELGAWLGLIARHRGSPPEIANVYIGGGSPSFWFDRTRIQRLFENTELEEGDQSRQSLWARLNGSLRELTLELHPQDWPDVESPLKWLYEKLNTNLRLSIGVQSCRESSLKAIGRLAMPGQGEEYLNNVEKALVWALDRNLTVNLDFMWGLTSSSIEDELNEIEKRLHTYYQRVAQYTFYHIWSPDDLERAADYRDETAALASTTCGATPPPDAASNLDTQRERLRGRLDAWGFEQDIYVEYFKKKGAETPNGYNRGEMRDDDYLACGLGVHGKLGRLLYLNYDRIEQYATNLDRNYTDRPGQLEQDNWKGPFLPVSRFHFIPERSSSHEYSKRKAMLRLRLPGEAFKAGVLRKLLSDPDEIHGLTDTLGNGEVALKPTTATNAIPRLLSEIVQRDTVENASWHVREVHALCRKVADFFTANEPSGNNLRRLAQLLTYDLFRLSNYVTKCKVKLCNAAYYSSILGTAVLGDRPWGLLPTEESAWMKAAQDRREVDPDAKLSLFELFFRQVAELGVPHPLRITRAQHQAWGNGNERKQGFLDFVKQNTRSEDLLLTVQQVSQDMAGVPEFLRLVDFFLDPQHSGREYLYFIAAKMHPVGKGCGGVIVSCEGGLSDDEVTALGDATMPVFALLSEFEHRAYAARHALRSAVAAIMARNMSHNLGSHGIARVVAAAEREIASSKRGWLAGSDDVGFLRHIELRMDFIAEVTTFWREMKWLEQLTS